MSVPEVPADVDVSLLRAEEMVRDLRVPDHGPIPATYWATCAQADELAQQAYERLHAWAVTAGWPRSMRQVIEEAVAARAISARRAREREAAALARDTGGAGPL